MKVFTFLYPSSPNLMEKFRFFFVCKVTTQQHFEPRLFWKNSEKLRVHTSLASHAHRHFFIIEKRLPSIEKCHPWPHSCPSLMNPHPIRKIVLYGRPPIDWSDVRTYMTVTCLEFAIFIHNVINTVTCSNIRFLSAFNSASMNRNRTYILLAH